VTDEEFLQAFENCQLPNEAFHHREHIRLAWICLQRFGADAAIRVAQGIRKFAAGHGKSDRYHETITVAWMKLLQKAGSGSFEDMVRRYPEILSKDYLQEFYSAEVLGSEAARAGFLEPDKKALALPARVW
jgi:N-formylglutamate deformylase